MPQYRTTSDIARNAKIGDVCRIEGDNMAYIKVSDTQVERLQISGEDYYELFPPVERFASRQERVGDCFLVAAAYTFYNTPETRADFLRCFRTNGCGGIEVNVGGVTKTYGPSGFQTIHIDANQNGRSFISGSNGFKMFEETTGFGLIPQKTKELTAELSRCKPGSERYIEIMRKLSMLASGDINTQGFAARSGGSSEYIASFLGIQYSSIDSPQKMIDTIRQTNNWDKYSFIAYTGGSKDTRYFIPEKNIAQNHAYNIEPFVSDNGEIMIRVTNPWSCANNVVLSLGEFQSCFNYLMCVKR